MTTQKEHRAALVKALRGDGYEQGKYSLRNNQDEFCCLGVACDLIDSNVWGNCMSGDEYRYNNASSSTMSEHVKDKYGFITIDGGFKWSTMSDKMYEKLIKKHPSYNSEFEVRKSSSLMMLNDGGVSFDLIADIIESTPGLFVENEELAS